MNVLVLNSGSSSLKFQLIATDPGRSKQDRDQRVCRGAVNGIGGKQAEVSIHTDDGPEQHFKAAVDNTHAALDTVFNWLTSQASTMSGIRDISDVHAVGHRVVHGGERFSQSVLITDDVLEGIRECIEFAPLHNSGNIDGILAARKFFGLHVPQVAVFDTAFHHQLPEHAYLYALPYRFYQQHRIRRYGFHGTSHRYVSHRYSMLRRFTPEQTNVISLHLGNGCSAAAIKAGRSVDTSMGMTPLEGLVMGTRSGDLDPTIVNAIAEKENLSLDQTESLLNTQSGLLGISGFSNDMRELQQEFAHNKNPQIALAIDVFCYRARKYIGAYLAAMSGADAIIFTAGIGENSPQVREQICQGLAWAGLTLDAEKNRKAIGVEAQISTDDSKLLAYCIPTDEELLIARDTVSCVLAQSHSAS